MDKRHKQSPHYYPLLLHFQNRDVVVVGGGPVAERKVKALLDCHARVKLISPRITQGLKRIVRQGQVHWYSRPFRKSDLRGAFLIFAATDDPEVNHLIATSTKKGRKLINVANLPGESNFLVPAVVRRRNLIIAVSTSGHTPALARKIRQELERAFGHEFSRFIEILGKVRKALMASIPQQSQRKRILNRLIHSEVLDLLRSGHFATAKRRVQEITGLEKTDF